MTSYATRDEQPVIAMVAGARPNFVKIAALYHALKRYQDCCRYVVVHTGQHYDQNLSGVFFEELGLPHPDVHLDVGSGSHGEQTARALTGIERFLLDHPVDFLLCVGDVNSTLAAALAAAKLGVPCGHVEAGLRSRDRSMPEEINRIATDHTADWLYTPSVDAGDNLIHEGIDPARIHFAGNVMIDTLMAQLPRIADSDAPERLGVTRGKYVLVTLHRPSNVDDVQNHKQILTILERLSRLYPIVFPMHPRTRARLLESGSDLSMRTVGDRTGLHICDPLGYIDFLSLQRSAHAVLTDSGGVQEETTALGVPCLTLRPNTERPITVFEGTNILVGFDPDRIVRIVENLGSRSERRPCLPCGWDGQAADRIIRHVLFEALGCRTLGSQTGGLSDSRRTINKAESELVKVREVEAVS